MKSPGLSFPIDKQLDKAIMKQVKATKLSKADVVRQLLRKALGITALLLALSIQAQASDFYLNLGVGASLMQRTTQNGTWFQEGQPYSMNLTDLAGMAGVGYRINPEWAVELNGLSFGQATSAGLAVPDEHYDPSAHKPKKGAPKPNHFDARQRSFGGELVAVRSFQVGAFRPFLKAGGFATYNNMPYTILSQPDMHVSQDRYTGYTVGVAGGGGVCWQMVCAQATYYRGMGSSGYPISKSTIVPMLTVQVPF